MKKTLAAVALLGMIGATGVAQAATATLSSVTSESSHGSSELKITGNTSTWDLDTATGVATQTGGTFLAETKLGPVTLMFTHTMMGGVLSSGAASATSWTCTEGTFGGTVGASLCGNYTFGANFANDSTYTPTATGATVAIGGDDVVSGPPQTLANSYSNLMLKNLDGGNWSLSNVVPLTSGYTFTFNVPAVVPVPAAVWLFGSAIGLMGVMRRRVVA